MCFMSVNLYSRGIGTFNLVGAICIYLQRHKYADIVFDQHICSLTITYTDAWLYQHTLPTETVSGVRDH